MITLYTCPCTAPSIWFHKRKSLHSQKYILENLREWCNKVKILQKYGQYMLSQTTNNMCTICHNIIVLFIFFIIVRFIAVNRIFNMASVVEIFKIGFEVLKQIGTSYVKFQLQWTSVFWGDVYHDDAHCTMDIRQTGHAISSLNFRSGDLKMIIPRDMQYF